MTALRSIQTNNLPRIDRDPGRKPELEWLPIRQLVIDGDYQRPLERTNWTQIKKIAASFDWAHFTPVVVARLGDDLFSVIDGQHRCHAAKLIGVVEVPCVIHDLTQQQQARAFAAINGQVTAVSSFHLYRAALAACEPWAVTAEKVVADAGCRLMTFHASAANKKPGEVYSVQLIKKHVESGHGANVTAVLRAMWSSPSAQTPQLWTNDIMSPLLVLAQDNPRLLKRGMGAFLAENCPAKTRQGAAKMRAMDAYRDKTLRELFNKLLHAQLTKWMAEGMR